MESRTDLLRGTLDVLILRSLTTAPLHGLGIARRIAQMTSKTTLGVCVPVSSSANCQRRALCAAPAA